MGSNPTGQANSHFGELNMEDRKNSNDVFLTEPIGAFNSDYYTDNKGIKRWRDTDQPVERELRDWDPKQMEFNFDL